MDQVNVVLSGNVASGFSAETVRTHLAQLVRKDVAAVAHLLRGKETIVRSGVDRATGERYLKALQAIGVDVRLEDTSLELDIGTSSPAPERAVVAGATTGRGATPSPKSHRDPENVERSAGLWNPHALANWSVLFTPVFGAILASANWRQLGNQGRADAAMRWAYGAAIVAGLPFLGILIGMNGTFDPVLVSVLMGTWPFLVVLTLGLWYFLSIRPQARFIRDNFGTAYARQSWGKPLGVAVTAVVALAVAWYSTLSYVASSRQTDNATLASPSASPNAGHPARPTRSPDRPQSKQKSEHDRDSSATRQIPPTTLPSGTSSAPLMDMDDLRVDIASLNGRKVRVRGVGYYMMNMFMLTKSANDANFIFVDIARLRREERLQIMQQCSDMNSPPCRVIIHGTVETVSAQNGIVAERIEW